MSFIQTFSFEPRHFADDVACTGQQVAAVVYAIEQARPDLLWYSADIECTGESWTRREPVPAKIGGTKLFLVALSRVDQFLSGVFFAVAPDRAAPRLRNPAWTDDADDAELGDALVELRAVDTSFLLARSVSEEVSAKMSLAAKAGWRAVGA